jgi:plastocyanin
MVVWSGTRAALVVASGVVIAMLGASCTVVLPASAPAEATPLPLSAGEIRQVRGVVPSPTVPVSAARQESLPSGAPPPTPLPATAAPLAPDLPPLPLPPRGQSDVQLNNPSTAAATANAATAVASIASQNATAAASPIREISIQDLAFSPATLTVVPGTRVIWRNRDPMMHQVRGGDFDSGRMQAGQYWASVLEKPGRYTFVCAFHPTMRAEITVSPDDSRPIHLGS